LDTYPSETASRTRQLVGQGLILSIGNRLDGCGFLLVDLM